MVATLKSPLFGCTVILQFSQPTYLEKFWALGHRTRSPLGRRPRASCTAPYLCPKR